MHYMWDLITSKRNNKLSFVWVAATRGIRHLTPKQIENVNVPKQCAEIIKMATIETATIRKKLSYNLTCKLCFGLIRIHREQVNKLNEIVTNWYIIFHTPKGKRVTDKTKKKYPDIRIEEIPDILAKLPRTEEIIPNQDLITLRETQILPVSKEQDLDVLTEADLDEIMSLAGTVARASDIGISKSRKAHLESSFEIGLVREDKQPILLKDLAPDDFIHPGVVPQQVQEHLEVTEPVIEPIHVVPQPTETHKHLEEQVVPKHQFKLQDDLQDTKKPVSHKKKKRVPVSKYPELPVLMPERECDPNSEAYQHYDSESSKKIDLIFIENFVPKEVLFIITSKNFTTGSRESVYKLFSSEQEELFEFQSRKRKSSISIETPEKLRKSPNKTGSPIQVITNLTDLDEIRLPDKIRPLEESSVVKSPNGTRSIQMYENIPAHDNIPPKIRVLEDIIIPAPPLSKKPLGEEQELDKQMDWCVESQPQIPVVSEEFDHSISESNITRREKQDLDVDERHATLIGIIQNWDFAVKKLTLPDVCFKPVNRRNAAITFSDLLFLAKFEYVSFQAEPGTINLAYIEKGTKLVY